MHDGIISMYKYMCVTVYACIMYACVYSHIPMGIPYIHV